MAKIHDRLNDRTEMVGHSRKAEQETIFLNNQDVEGRDKRAFDQTKELINRLSQEGSISKVQLMKQLFDADTEELLQLLRESENE